MQISATNIAAVLWHCQWRLPFRYFGVDENFRVERGYALKRRERDVRLVAEIQPDMLRKSEDYGIRSDVVSMNRLH